MIDHRVLEDVPLFSGLNEAARRELRSGAVRHAFEPGGRLWSEGQPAQGLFVLLGGCVRILGSRDGRQHVVHVVDQPGATLGEVPLFEGRGYPATARAVTTTRCLVVDGAALRRAMAADPSLGERLLARLGGRVRELVARLDAATTGTVRSRLASFLLNRAREVDGRAVVVYGSQHELAEELGTVREVVGRELARLRRSGMVSVAGRGVVEIGDPRRLAAVARDEAG